VEPEARAEMWMLFGAFSRLFRFFFRFFGDYFSSRLTGDSRSRGENFERQIGPRARRET
jgi:hypothetical protein